MLYVFFLNPTGLFCAHVSKNGPQYLLCQKVLHDRLTHKNDNSVTTSNPTAQLTD
jgi:hypothetical protein